MSLNTLPLADQVYNLLLEDIFAGKRPAGEKISEESISVEFGISRTPAREALMRLAADGLIDRTARKGCRINAINRAAQRDLVECRARIEALALELGLDDIPVNALDSIAQLLDDARRTHDTKASLAADDLLHGLIASACPNRTLAAIMENLICKCKAFRAYRAASADATMICDERAAIIQAIRQGDRASACRLLAEHIRHGAPA
ncbi:MAG TPA: GntR family transcriptional regulator [Armatimonadota bacterium]|jgi:DNA-binding GntR family transcriptional regulator